MRSGRQYVLQGGDYRADVASVGASLRRLQWRGRDLVVPYEADEVRPYYRGAVLAPWPNRVADGKWTWHGDPQQLPLTEPERGHALHGLALWLDWQPREVTPDSVVLTTTIWPQPGYPFLIELAATWRLGADGLECRLIAVNGGAGAAPYGCGFHPYLTAPTGVLDEWSAHVPAERYLRIDERLITAGLETPRPEHDFRTPRQIGPARIDHTYTDVQFGRSGRAAVTVTDASGRGSRIEFGPGTTWVQLWTADYPGEAGDRAGLAVEPMSCPPNALQTGADLVVIEPGQRHEAWWRLCAIEGLPL
jgi:aldose 1-epimerase